MEGGAGFCFTCAAGAPGDQDVGGLLARCPQEADEQWDTCSPCKTSLLEPEEQRGARPLVELLGIAGAEAASLWDPGPGAN